MGKLILAAIASIDGWVEDEEGKFDWSTPDEVHAFVNDLRASVHRGSRPPPQNGCFQVHKACHTLRTALGEDVLVVADAVLDDVNQTLGHGPPGRLVERDRCKVLDSRVQLENGVATVGDHRLTMR